MSWVVVYATLRAFFNMDIQGGWDYKTERMLNELPVKFATMFDSVITDEVQWATHRALSSVLSKVPSFEFDLANSLGIFGEDTRVWKYKGRHTAYIGFVNELTIVNGEDVVTAPTPFNYGWIKHEGEQTQGAHPHRVYLYNPKTGQSTAGRAKLVRWLKSKGSPWSKLPDAPTKDYWNKRKKEPDNPPPFVDVDPGASATNYLSHLKHEDRIWDEMFNNIVKRVGAWWEGWKP